jgi:hypothetical protein
MLKIIILSIILFLLFTDSLKLYLIKNNFLNENLYNLSCKRDFEIHTLIKKYLKPNCRILNFGCGLNTYTELLELNGYTVFPLDVIDQSIYGTVNLYDGETLPKEHKFDYTIISTVLHHIPIDKQYNILKQIKEISKNIIIIEDYIGEDLFSFIKTSLICAFANLSFIDREYSFRNNREWMELFNYLEPKNINYESCDFEIYLLEF